MLIVCPECEGKVSDRAYSCPHCGYPLSKKSRPKPSKRLRLPNGFGRITEIKGSNLRKPFRAVVTVGKNENGQPIGKVLKPEGYFATYNEAYKALMDYHMNPYDFDNDVTLKDVYEKWFLEKEKQVGASRLRAIRSAWSYCFIIENEKIQTIRTKIIRTVLDEGYRLDEHGNKVYPSDNIKRSMKNVLSEIMDYAVEREIVQHNYVKDIKLITESKDPNGTHIPFTKEEINIIKAHLDIPIIQIIYVNCYTGFRPSELCGLLTTNLDTSQWTIIGGMKTKAGKKRLVPIHRNIRGIIQDFSDRAIETGKTYLIPNGKVQINYDSYSDRFIKAMKDYGLNESHRPHDCRKHFVTMAKNAGVDEYAIKRIVGHSIQDITESVYTERDVSWLHKEIAKIP